MASNTNPPNEKVAGPNIDSKEIFEMLSAYLALEFPWDAAFEIGNHLTPGEAQTEFLASLRSIAEMCREYQPSELPETVREDARRRVLDAYLRLVTAESPPQVSPPR